MADHSNARAVSDARVRIPRPMRPRTRAFRSVTRPLIVMTTLALALAGLAPAVVSAAPAFRVSTTYPAVVVAPGNKVSFNVDITTPAPERVTLALTGAPSGWTATLHGGGYLVDAVLTDGTTTASTVRVDVTVPDNATGTANLTLTATAGSESRTLPLSIRVEAAATGDITLTTDVPTLQGPASQTFNFNLTLTNDTSEDVTIGANATGPDGWNVTAKLATSSQAASTVVKANATGGITVTAVPPASVEAGDYDIDVVVTAGSRTIPGKLAVKVTGSYNLALSTPDQRLNGHGSAGANSDVTLTVTNSGTSPVTKVTLTSTPPTGWKVTFDPATIDSLGANQTQNVIAHIVPSGDAVAGDYVLTMKAAGSESTTSNVDIRFTVETSFQWAIVGIALIVAVVAGLAWVFQRYGRR